MSPMSLDQLSVPINHGFEITRHRFKGVYMWRSRRRSNRAVPFRLCTLVDRDDVFETNDGQEEETIQLTLQGPRMAFTFRLWDPNTCIVAAGIHKQLLHFPIRAGGCVFTLDCSLQTLRHIADIIGPRGRMVAVYSKTSAEMPPREARERYFQKRPFVSVFEDDVQNATADRYRELLGGIPNSSKYAFLMAFHARLGAESPARLLAADPDASKALAKRVFDFLEVDLPFVSCLIVGSWPAGSGIDMVRGVVLSHIEIFQSLGRSKEGKRSLSKASVESTSKEEPQVAQPSGRKESKREGSKASVASTLKGVALNVKEDKKRGNSLRWVILNVPLEHSDPSDGAGNESLTHVADLLKRCKSGLRTGLSPKEQVTLRPHFPDGRLLVLKYEPSKDERLVKASAEGSDQELKRPPLSEIPAPTFISLGVAPLPQKPDGKSGSARAPRSQAAVSTVESHDESFSSSLVKSPRHEPELVPVADRAGSSQKELTPFFKALKDADEETRRNSEGMDDASVHVDSSNDGVASRKQANETRSGLVGKVTQTGGKPSASSQLLPRYAPQVFSEWHYHEAGYGGCKGAWGKGQYGREKPQQHWPYHNAYGTLWDARFGGVEHWRLEGGAPTMLTRTRVQTQMQTHESFGWAPQDAYGMCAGASWNFGPVGGGDPWGQTGVLRDDPDAYMDVTKEGKGKPTNSDASASGKKTDGKISGSASRQH